VIEEPRSGLRVIFIVPSMLLTRFQVVEIPGYQSLNYENVI
jgi:hypothetical protein